MNSRPKFSYTGKVKAKKPWEIYLGEQRTKVKDAREEEVDTDSLAA